MLYLRTGLPGAGKTLNAIREIDIEHQPDPENPERRLHKDPDHPDLPPRTIYYYGIPDLKADRLKSKWVEFDTPEEWFKLPDGSVIVIDEAQRVFGNDGTRARPEKVTRFETHRHQGLDIHLITQHPSLLSSPVRKLVGKHINFIRPYGREKGIFRHEYEFCIDSPEKRANFKQAQEEKVSLDPTYFGVYKSSTVHTHKPTTPSYLKKLPLMIVLTLIPILGVAGLFYAVIHQAQSEKEAAQKAAGLDSAPAAAGSVSGVSGVPGTPVSRVPASAPAAPAVQTVQQYISDRTPRIEAMPASAPRYDELTKPRDFPKPFCVASEDPRVVLRSKHRGLPVDRDDHGIEFTCSCYSQQSTRIHTTAQFCLDAVRNGIFDDTRIVPQIASGRTPGGVNNGPTPEPGAIQRGRAASSPPAIFADSTVSPVAQEAVFVGGLNYDPRAKGMVR